ncbi:outer membrane beta-barrel protein [Mucilaginibacter sp. AW1-3]
MKRLIITAIFCGMLGSVYAQQKSDPNKSKSDTIIIKHKTWYNKALYKDSIKKAEAKKNNNGFSIGVSFYDFHLGFATLLDNGSFTLSPKNSFLNYSQGKTSYVGFSFFKFGYRFNDHFKIWVSGGFDWTHIRLQKNINIVPDVPTLTYVVDTVNHFTKNRFTSNYLMVPLAFDFRTSPDRHNNRFHVIAGPEVGFLIDGMQKQISPEHGKTKNYNDFHFDRFEIGGSLKVGYGSFGLFTKYFFNDMFVNSPDQKGLKSFNFGLQFGF